MTTQIQLRRGNTAEVAAFTGAIGEVVVDTEQNTLVVNDGVTQGGHYLATEIQINYLDNRINAISGGITLSDFASTVVIAQEAYDTANSAGIYANSGISLAQASFDVQNGTAIVANTAIHNAASASAYANSGISLAQAAFNVQNGTAIVANTKFSSSGGTISGDVNVTGNLTVTGSTFYANTTNLQVEDNIVTLNSNVTGAPTLNAGISVNRGSSANTSLVWNEANKDWEFTNDGTTYQVIANTSSVASASQYANTGISNAASASLYANNGIALASAAYDHANTASQYALQGIVLAEQGIASANVATFNAGSASVYANNGIALAQAAFGHSNTTSNTFVGTDSSSASPTGSSVNFSSSNGVTVTGSGNTLTISTPQDLRTTATPTFNGMTVTGNVIPSLDVTYDLGSSTHRFKDLWLSGQTIKLGSSSVTTDPSTGAIALVPAASANNPNPTALVFTANGGITTVPSTAGSIDAAHVASAIANTGGSTFDFTLVSYAANTANLAVQIANTALSNTSGSQIFNSNSTLLIANTTDSTSTSSGSLTVAGGLGVSKNVRVSGMVYATGFVANTQSIVTSAGGQTTLTPQSPQYLILTGTNGYTVSLPDVGSVSTGTTYYINNNTSGTTSNIIVKDFNGTSIFTVLPGSDVEFISSGTGQTWDTHSFLPSNSQYGRYTFNTGTSANVTIGQTTAATSTTTGALTVAGGVGVAGNLYAATVYSGGNQVLTSETVGTAAYAQANTATNIANTKFSSSGGTISGDVNVTGNLTITGTTFYANTTNLRVEDNIVTLNSNVTSGTPTLNAGIEVSRGDLAKTSLVWNETNKDWEFTNDGSNFQVIANTSSVTTAINNAASASLYANTAINNSAIVGIYANNAINNAASASNYANTAYTNAATAVLNAQSALNSAISASVTANVALNNAGSASNYANVGIQLAQAAFNTANASSGSGISASNITSGTLSPSRFNVYGGSF
jgi:trimeric autotransporter adhesin